MFKKLFLTLTILITFDFARIKKITRAGSNDNENLKVLFIFRILIKKLNSLTRLKSILLIIGVFKIQNVGLIVYILKKKTKIKIIKINHKIHQIFTEINLEYLNNKQKVFNKIEQQILLYGTRKKMNDQKQFYQMIKVMIFNL